MTHSKPVRATLKPHFALMTTTSSRCSFTRGGTPAPRTYRRNSIFSVFLLLLVSCVAANLAVAQEPDDVVRVDTALVQLNVGVVDARGQVVRSLSQSDFTVYENGVKQP